MPKTSTNTTMPENDVPRVVTKKQAMTLLHCSRSYVEQLAAKGLIRYWRPTYRHNLYSLDDIEVLLGRPFNESVVR